MVHGESIWLQQYAPSILLILVDSPHRVKANKIPLHGTGVFYLVNPRTQWIETICDVLDDIDSKLKALGVVKMHGVMVDIPTNGVSCSGAHPV